MTDNQEQAVIELALAQTPTHEIGHATKLPWKRIRQIINAARGRGVEIKDSPHRHIDMDRDQREAMLNDWATARFSLPRLADKHTDGSYYRCRAIIDAARIAGDERAFSLNERKRAYLQRKAEAMERRRNANRGRLAQEVGIRVGPTRQIVYHLPNGERRVNNVTLSAGLI